MAINAYEFDEIARNIFAPAYPLLAEQIVSCTQISRGVCLDLGSGGGYLGLSLAKISNLNVCLLDESADNKKIAESNISQWELSDRVWAIEADVHDLPIQDASVDLVASRSSIFFWERPEQAFKEIDRVLIPGGYAYIGGGFGSEELRCSIEEQMQQRSPDWRPKFDERRDDAYFSEQLHAAGISTFRIRKDASGFWIMFRKETTE